MTNKIAIDGPAGAGKSTIAKAVAKKMNYIYVDTGSMYRAMALFFLRNQIDASNQKEIEEKCDDVNISIGYVDGVQVVYLNGENVNAYLRTEEVGNMASATSSILKVRQKLVQLQKELAEKENVVMDGRDIATCVLPNAQLKIYLTASSFVRAKRRYDELTARGEQVDFEAIKADIEDRDYRDMHREHSPLRQAEDAIYLDSSELSIDEVIGEIMALCQKTFQNESNI